MMVFFGIDILFFLGKDENLGSLCLSQSENHTLASHLAINVLEKLMEIVVISIFLCSGGKHVQNVGPNPQISFNFCQSLFFISLQTEEACVMKTCNKFSFKSLTHFKLSNIHGTSMNIYFLYLVHVFCSKTSLIHAAPHPPSLLQFACLST